MVATRKNNDQRMATTATKSIETTLQTIEQTYWTNRPASLNRHRITTPSNKDRRRSTNTNEDQQPSTNNNKLKFQYISTNINNKQQKITNNNIDQK